MQKQQLDLELPVVCNIQEAKNWAKDFGAILTVGPNKNEVRLKHNNHAIFTFSDTTFGANAPTLEVIEQAIDWGQDKEDLLVHCHAGISRSTSTAWGISIARGADPLESFLTLRDAQPLEDFEYGFQNSVRRPFAPNRLIVSFLEDIFALDGLLEIRNEYMSDGWN